MLNKENILVVLFLFAAVFVCYGNLLTAGFVWDDDSLVVNNPLLRAPVYSFKIFQEDISNSHFYNTIYYRPIQILSYAVEYRLWGLSPAMFHFTSIFIHFLNVLLVFYLAQKLLKKKAVSFLAALFFAVNPVNSGVVSYISSRADLLLFFFGLLTLISFVYFREEGKPSYLVSCVVFLIMALLGKEAAVIVPFLMLLIDIFMPGKRTASRVFAHLPGFAVIGCYAVTHHVLFGDRYGAVFASAPLRVVTDYFGMAAKFFTLGLFPLDPHLRRFAAMTSGTAFEWAVPVIAIFIVFLFLENNRRMALFSVLFMVIALVPAAFVVGYFKVIGEQWMYVPSFGLFLFMAIFFADLYENRGRFVRPLVFAAVVASVAFYSSVTTAQCANWKNDAALSDRVLGYSGKDLVAMHYKAVSLVKEGESGRSLKIMEDYVKSDPNDPRAWYIKGRVELAAGRIENASKDFMTAVKTDARYADGYLGLAFAEVAKGNVVEGIKYLEKVLQLEPRHVEALTFLASVYSKSGNEPKALEMVIRAKHAAPYNYEVLNDLGTAYIRSGKTWEGAMEYSEAIKLYPEKPMAYYNLAYVFHESGRDADAVTYLHKALDKDPLFKPAIELLHEIRKGK